MSSKKSYSFSSESVTPGHPDKMSDQVSDAVLDAALEHDPASRVACETVFTTGMCMITGEMTTATSFDVARIARSVIRDIGYDCERAGFDGGSCSVIVALGEQSLDIAEGVAKSDEMRSGMDVDELDEQGAGDQGMMFGYATDETEALMPVAIHQAHALAQRLTEVRKTGEIPYLLPDGKTQVTFEYEDDRPVRLQGVLISSQHARGVDPKSMRDDIVEQVIRKTILDEYADDDPVMYVNPSGRFEVGGPRADAGLTGRKIIVDTYGGMGRHGGGAFSGKDPSKVDRSGAYGARWVAKHVVASGLASRCEVQVAYAIGMARPMSVHVNTFGTENADPRKIEEAVLAVFDLRPAAIIRDLRLLRPIYRKTAAYGHFGRNDPDFTWEHTDRIADLLRAVGG